MSFRPTTKPPIQDMPPPGGFPGLDLARKARARGLSGFQIWAFSTLAVAYGFYRVGVNNHEDNGNKLLDRQSRYAMVPLLQAEEDRWYMAREREINKKEAEIMKDVPDWKVGARPYYSDRWVPRQTAPLNKNVKK